MLRKERAPEAASPRRPDSEEEWQLIHRLAEYPHIVADSAVNRNPSMVAGFLYETAKTFSRFYHDHPIAVAEEASQREFRLALSRAVVNVMQHGLYLLNMPFVEAM